MSNSIDQLSSISWTVARHLNQRRATVDYYKFDVSTTEARRLSQRRVARQALSRCSSRLWRDVDSNVEQESLIATAFPRSATSDSNVELMSNLIDQLSSIRR